MMARSYPEILEMLGEQADQAGEDQPVAVILLDREQAHLEHLVAGRQVGVEAGHFLVERKRPLPPAGHHAHQAFAVQADGVGVVGVKLVHQPLLGVPRMLGDLLHERLVIQAVDRLEFPGPGCNLESQGRFRLLHSVLCALASALLLPGDVLRFERSLREYCAGGSAPPAWRRPTAPRRPPSPARKEK